MYAHFNYIQPLQITKKIARLGDHSGDCQEDCERIVQLPEIRRQLEKIEPEQLRKELYEYGAWDDEQLADHEQNLVRIIWIACGNINEELYLKQRNKK